MLKKLFAIFFISLCLSTSIPIVIGFVIKTKYQQTIDQINQNQQQTQNISIKMLNYKKHLFSSTANLLIKIPANHWHNKMQFKLQQKLSHGNITWQPNTKLLATSIKSKLLESENIKIKTMVSLDGTCTTLINTKAIEQKASSNLALKWDKLNIAILHDLTMNEINGLLKIPQMQLSQNKWLIQLQELNLFFNPNIKSKLYGKQITINNQNNSIFSAQNYQVNWKILTNKTNLSDLDLDLDLKTTKILKQSFINNKINIKINNLNFNINKNLFTKNLAKNNTSIDINSPKYLSEALTGLVGLYIYKNSQLGKFDSRSTSDIYAALSKEITNSLQQMIKDKKILDLGTHYKYQMAFN